MLLENKLFKKKKRKKKEKKRNQNCIKDREFSILIQRFEGLCMKTAKVILTEAVFHSIFCC